MSKEKKVSQFGKKLSLGKDIDFDDVVKSKAKELEKAPVKFEKTSTPSSNRTSFVKNNSSVVAEQSSSEVGSTNAFKKQKYSYSKQKMVDEDEEEEIASKSSIKRKKINRDKGATSGNIRNMSIQDFMSVTDEGEEIDFEDEAEDLENNNKKLSSKVKKEKKLFIKINIKDNLPIKEFADILSKKADTILKKVQELGVEVKSIDSIIDFDIASIIAEEMGYKANRIKINRIKEDVYEALEQSHGKLQARPPIVAVMGHVDHGKTSILDKIRNKSVAAAEHGGITQHIGAYQYKNAQGKAITFLDTPGHEAFAKIRSRGANVTDIVILVVAADDGIKAQTIEAIGHAKASGAKIIVAVNKIDKEGGDINRVELELLQHEIITEKMGGDVLLIGVSALNGTNIDALIDLIFLQAEMMDLKAPQSGYAKGIIIEAKQVLGQGNVATVIVEEGELKVGDVFAVGSTYGKVKNMKDADGKEHRAGYPSEAFEINGFKDLPTPGDELVVAANEDITKKLAEYNKSRLEEEGTSKFNVQDIFSKMENSTKELNLIIKADAFGSLESIVASISKLHTNEVATKVIFKGVGAVTESDFNLAKMSGAIIIGFNVREDIKLKNILQKEKGKMDKMIRYHSVIYRLIDDVKMMLSGMLDPDIVEKIIGNAEVRQIFDISSVGRIAGCYVVEGVIKRDSILRVIRNGEIMHQGPLKQLKRMKDDVLEVKHSYECGISFEKFDSIEVGDLIESVEKQEVARQL